MFERGIEDSKQVAHGGNQRDFGRFTALARALVKGAQCGLMWLPLTPARLARHKALIAKCVTHVLNEYNYLTKSFWCGMVVRASNGHGTAGMSISSDG